MIPSALGILPRDLPAGLEPTGKPNRNQFAQVHPRECEESGVVKIGR